MTYKMFSVLSILVITHNQRDLLKRCLDSVLGQKLNIPFEVIVSDDRSEDGTAEYVAELQEQVISGKRFVPNLQEIVYTCCNSNDCDPANVSERCGWNKLNAYKHARGKFFVNIDADDFLRSNDVYQSQIDMLEKYPECSMCMQDVWQVKDGDDIVNGHRWPSFNKLHDEQILTVKDIIFYYRALNQCYMIRRHPEFDIENYYGKFYDDTIITLHHLQYGPCVWIDRADYVWVLYNTSITRTLRGDDELISYSLLPFHHIRFIPKFAGMLMHDAIPLLTHFYKILCDRSFNLILSERTLKGLSRSEGFIYERIFRRFSIFDKIRVYFIRCLLLIINKNNIASRRLFKLLFVLNIHHKAECLSSCDWSETQ